jgi:hypothetical protein
MVPKIGWKIIKNELPRSKLRGIEDFSLKS